MLILFICLFRTLALMHEFVTNKMCVCRFLPNHFLPPMKTGILKKSRKKKQKKKQLLGAGMKIETHKKAKKKKKKQLRERNEAGRHMECTKR